MEVVAQRLDVMLSRPGNLKDGLETWFDKLTMSGGP